MFGSMKDRAVKWAARRVIAQATLAALLLGHSAAAETKPAPPTPPACSDARPASLNNFKVTVDIDPTSAWRTPGDDVEFALQGSGLASAGVQVVACFRWSQAGPGKGQWKESPSLRLANGTDQNKLSFLATMPDLGDPPGSWFNRVFNGANTNGAWTALALVPLADFRVIAKPSGSTTWTLLDETQTVGVTSGTMALIVMIAVVCLAWAVLYTFGRSRKLPGAHDPVLQIISTQHGVASLSQLQIILWTFVVGGCAVYVMVLSGNLIIITSGTLTLLGISGVAALGSKLQSGISGPPPAPPPPMQPPNAVTDLRVSQAEEPNQARLFWNAPALGPQPDTYTVSYQKAGDTTWTEATAALLGPGFVVVNLAPSQDYNFQVVAVNAAGPGAPASTSGKTAPTPSGAIGPITGFGAAGVATNRKLSFAWDAYPLKVSLQYCVQYRRRNSDDDWHEMNVNQTKCQAVATGLDASTTYDVRAAVATSSTAAIFGNWTTTTVATIGPRIPRWSDLVIDGSREVDVTRVQMLFFTVVVAVFVVMRVLTGGEIPEVPPAFLTLMGLSNALYLGAKFVPQSS